MTSSWSLTQRKKMGSVWDVSNFGDPNNSLGGWEDYYITPGGTHECHPNYEAIPIGNPYGFMICSRRKYENGQGFDTPRDPIDPSEFNGYHKFSADLYRPWRETEIQITDPYNYYDRTTPNEALLHQTDYLARDIKFNATGVNPVHTPGPRKYHEYGYSYSPNPPYKYDVNRLHQGYPAWKETQIYHGLPQKTADRIDRQYDKCCYRWYMVDLSIINSFVINQ